MRQRAKKDGSHKAVAAKLVEFGADVADTSRLGDGFPDFVARMDRPCPHCKRKFKQNVLVELKEVGGRITPSEEKWHDAHPGMAEIWVAIWQGNILLLEKDGQLVQLRKQ